MRSAALQLILASLVWFLGCEPRVQASERITRGIERFYLVSPDGVRDQNLIDSSGNPPINIKVPPLSQRQLALGYLPLGANGTVIESAPSVDLIGGFRANDELTVEAWVSGSELNQPDASIVSLLDGSNNKWFSLGQQGHGFELKFRETGDGKVYLPATQVERITVSRELSHLVFVRNRFGDMRFYLNGKVIKLARLPDDLANWQGPMAIRLGDWQGSLHLLAIYSSALKHREVRVNYEAGPDAASPAPTESQVKQLTLEGNRFHNHIAPLLANHCLECHDPASNRGDLDLSTKGKAFANIDSDLLWESVEHDEMPHKRTPLSEQQKSQFLAWIENGAVWPLTKPIDPANYVYHGKIGHRWVRRLTRYEYIETVRATFGVDIESLAMELVPADLRADGFTNTAYNLTVDFKHVESYAKLAAAIVEQLDVAGFARRFSESRTADRHMRRLIRRMGSWILRSALTEAETDSYRGVGSSLIGSGGDFDKAVGHMIMAMLQSPRFIYRIETYSEKSKSVVDRELANRLSYAIWGSSPDEELIKKAKNGTLNDPEQCRLEIRRMLSDHKAMQQALRFAGEWLSLERLGSLSPDSDLFPQWDDQLAEEMRQETLAYFKDVVWDRKLPMSSLFNDQIIYLTPRLAEHYGLTYRGSGSMTRHDASAIASRGGLLTQGSLLSIGGDEASMVSRGLFVVNQVLRLVVTNPPPGVDTTPVPTKTGLSQRTIAEKRVARKSCGGCHGKFEPLAYGLEKYDGLGSYFETDHHGNQLRDDGHLIFPGESKEVAFRTSAELMHLLANHDRVSESIAWKLTQFIIGRELTAADLPAIEPILSVATVREGNYFNLLEAILLSDLVQLTHIEQL